MGQQQLLLIILGVIIVGIAVGVGISQFGAQSTESNKDGVTTGVINVGANAYQFKIRPTTMGGGSGSYLGYVLPTKLASDENGTYAASGASRTGITITGTSALNGSWTVTCTVDSTGKNTLVYTGW